LLGDRRISDAGQHLRVIRGSEDDVMVNLATINAPGDGGSEVRKQYLAA
jgi:hypothetical protein